MHRSITGALISPGEIKARLPTVPSLSDEGARGLLALVDSLAAAAGGADATHK